MMIHIRLWFICKIKFYQFCYHFNICSNLGHKHDESSVQMLKKFLVNCRRQLTNESNLFWVSLQSNVLADISNVESGFKEALEEMKNELKNNGWILPFLAYNM